MNRINKFTSLAVFSLSILIANASVGTYEFIKKIDKENIPLVSGIVNPYDVRFTQDSISAEFSDGTSVFDMIKKMREGKIYPEDIPAIRIFVKDGVLYSVDNRRLFLFQQVGAPIKYEMITNPDEVMKESFKFTTENDGRGIIVRSSKPQPIKAKTNNPYKGIQY